jgi:hypothetical protein
LPCAVSITGPTLATSAPIGTTTTVLVHVENPLPLPLEVTELSLTDGSGFAFADDVRAFTLGGGLCGAPKTLDLPVLFTATRFETQQALLTGKVAPTQPANLFPVRLVGVGVGPRLGVGDVSAGVIEVNQPARRELRLRNLGTVDSTLTVRLERLEAANATTRADELCLGSTCHAPLVVSVSRELVVPLELRAVTPGPKAWRLTVSPDSEFDRPVTVLLTAEALDTRGCALVATPGALRFELPGTTTAQATLENRGATPCLVVSLGVEGNPTFSIEPLRQPLRLEPGARTSVTVTSRFRPDSTLATGGLHVTAAPRALDVPLRFELADPSCLVLPTSLEFAPTEQGCRARTQAVTLANVCAHALALTGVATSEPFFLASTPLSTDRPLILAPGDQQRLVAVGALASLDAGVTTGTLSFSFHEASGRQVALSLTTTASRLVTERYDLRRPAQNLLFVVDDGPGMRPFLQPLATNLAALGWLLAPTRENTRVAFTTTGVGALREVAPGQRWLESGSASFASDWARVTAFDGGGSDSTACLATAVRSLRVDAADGGPNAGFLRGAPTRVVCVTHAVDGADVAGQQAFSDLFTPLVAIAPFDARCGDAGVGGDGWRAYASTTGGFANDLCAPWANDFLASDVGAQTRWRLGSLPEPSTLRVDFDGVEVAPTGDAGTVWRYEPTSNAVELTTFPEAELRLRYRAACL